MTSQWWLLVLLSAVAACSTGPGAAIDRLNDSRKQWDSQHITDYTFTVQRLCFCSDIQPVRVVVQGGQITSRTYVASGEPIPIGLESLYPSISGIFDFLEGVYRQADEVHVTFDANLGFPLQANIDFQKDAIDDELTLKITEFQR